MKRKRKVKGKRAKKAQEKNWEKAAALFEGKRGEKLMAESRALSPQERRKLLGPGKAKLISIRIPEDDLEALKKIAEKNDRKYQQLMVHAVEQFIDKYYNKGDRPWGI